MPDIYVVIFLQVSLDSSKEADLVHVTFPITIATVPFRIPNSNRFPSVKYGE